MEVKEKANILIVDDSPNKQNLLELILSPLDENLVILNSGKQALKFLLNQEAALIILDVKMPEMDGFETAAMIRKRKKNEFTPIIFVTAFSSADIEITRGYEMGAVDYMFTPLIPEILKSKVKVFLDLYRMNRILKNKNDEVENAYTSIQSLNNSLQEKTLQLERSNQELESFSYSVSHDLKAPLRGIDGYSKLLLDLYGSSLNEEAQAFISAIRSSTQQMEQLIDDLLEYSRLERSQMRSEKIKIKEMITSITSLFKDELNTGKFTLKDEVPDIELIADSKGLTIALRNLLENAIKFSRGKSKPTIEIALEENASLWMLSIKDNGIGFDIKYHQKIFEIFQRLHRADDFPGTGIGLAMVSKAMQRMNGKAWAKSSLGSGSTFYLEIPKLINV